MPTLLDIPTGGKKFGYVSQDGIVSASETSVNLTATIAHLNPAQFKESGSRVAITADGIAATDNKLRDQLSEYIRISTAKDRGVEAAILWTESGDPDNIQIKSTKTVNPSSYMELSKRQTITCSANHQVAVSDNLTQTNGGVAVYGKVVSVTTNKKFVVELMTDANYNVRKQDAPTSNDTALFTAAVNITGGTGGAITNGNITSATNIGGVANHDLYDMYIVHKKNAQPFVVHLRTSTYNTIGRSMFMVLPSMEKLALGMPAAECKDQYTIRNQKHSDVLNTTLSAYYKTVCQNWMTQDYYTPGYEGASTPVAPTPGGNTANYDDLYKIDLDMVDYNYHITGAAATTAEAHRVVPFVKRTETALFVLVPVATETAKSTETGKNKYCCAGVTFKYESSDTKFDLYTQGTLPTGDNHTTAADMTDDAGKLSYILVSDSLTYDVESTGTTVENLFKRVVPKLQFTTTAATALNAVDVGFLDMGKLALSNGENVSVPVVLKNDKTTANGDLVPRNTASTTLHASYKVDELDIATATITKTSADDLFTAAIASVAIGANVGFTLTRTAPANNLDLDTANSTLSVQVAYDYTQDGKWIGGSSSFETADTAVSTPLKLQNIVQAVHGTTKVPASTGIIASKEINTMATTQAMTVSIAGTNANSGGTITAVSAADAAKIVVGMRVRHASIPEGVYVDSKSGSGDARVITLSSTYASTIAINTIKFVEDRLVDMTVTDSGRTNTGDDNQYLIALVAPTDVIDGTLPNANWANSVHTFTSASDALSANDYVLIQSSANIFVSNDLDELARGSVKILSKSVNGGVYTYTCAGTKRHDNLLTIDGDETLAYGTQLFISSGGSDRSIQIRKMPTTLKELLPSITVESSTNSGNIAAGATVALSAAQAAWANKRVVIESGTRTIAATTATAGRRLYATFTDATTLTLETASTISGSGNFKIYDTFQSASNNASIDAIRTDAGGNAPVPAYQAFYCPPKDNTNGVFTTSNASPTLQADLVAVRKINGGGANSHQFGIPFPNSQSDIDPENAAANTSLWFPMTIDHGTGDIQRDVAQATSTVQVYNSDLDYIHIGNIKNYFKVDHAVLVTNIASTVSGATTNTAASNEFLLDATAASGATTVTTAVDLNTLIRNGGSLKAFVPNPATSNAATAGIAQNTTLARTNETTGTLSNALTAQIGDEKKIGVIEFKEVDGKMEHYIKGTTIDYKLVQSTNDAKVYAKSAANWSTHTDGTKFTISLQGNGVDNLTLTDVFTVKALNVGSGATGLVIEAMDFTPYAEFTVSAQSGLTAAKGVVVTQTNGGTTVTGTILEAIDQTSTTIKVKYTIAYSTGTVGAWRTGRTNGNVFIDSATLTVGSTDIAASAISAVSQKNVTDKSNGLKWFNSEEALGALGTESDFSNFEKCKLSYRVNNQVVHDFTGKLEVEHTAYTSNGALGNYHSNKNSTRAFIANDALDTVKQSGAFDQLFKHTLLFELKNGINAALEVKLNIDNTVITVDASGGRNASTLLAALATALNNSTGITARVGTAGTTTALNDAHTTSQIIVEKTSQFKYFDASTVPSFKDTSTNAGMIVAVPATANSNAAMNVHIVGYKDASGNSPTTTDGLAAASGKIVVSSATTDFFSSLNHLRISITPATSAQFGWGAGGDALAGYDANSYNNTTSGTFASNFNVVVGQTLKMHSAIGNFKGVVGGTEVSETAAAGTLITNSNATAALVSQKAVVTINAITQAMHDQTIIFQKHYNDSTVTMDDLILQVIDLSDNVTGTNSFTSPSGGGATSRDETCTVTLKVFPNFTYKVEAATAWERTAIGAKHATSPAGTLTAKSGTDDLGNLTTAGSYDGAVDLYDSSASKFMKLTITPAVADNNVGKPNNLETYNYSDTWTVRSINKTAGTALNYATDITDATPIVAMLPMLDYAESAGGTNKRVQFRFTQDKQLGSSATCVTAGTGAGKLTDHSDAVIVDTTYGASGNGSSILMNVHTMNVADFTGGNSTKFGGACTSTHATWTHNNNIITISAGKPNDADVAVGMLITAGSWARKINAKTVSSGKVETITLDGAGAAGTKQALFIGHLVLNVDQNHGTGAIAEDLSTTGYPFANDTVGAATAPTFTCFTTSAAAHGSDKNKTTLSMTLKGLADTHEAMAGTNYAGVTEGADGAKVVSRRYPFHGYYTSNATSTTEPVDMKWIVAARMLDAQSRVGVLQRIYTVAAGNNGDTPLKCHRRTARTTIATVVENAPTSIPFLSLNVNTDTTKNLTYTKANVKCTTADTVINGNAIFDLLGDGVANLKSATAQSNSAFALAHVTYNYTGTTQAANGNFYKVDVLTNIKDGSSTAGENKMAILVISTKTGGAVTPHSVNGVNALQMVDDKTILLLQNSTGTEFKAMPATSNGDTKIVDNANMLTAASRPLLEITAPFTPGVKFASDGGMEIKFPNGSEYVVTLPIAAIVGTVGLYAVGEVIHQWPEATTANDGKASGPAPVSGVIKGYNTTTGTVTEVTDANKADVRGIIVNVTNGTFVKNTADTFFRVGTSTFESVQITGNIVYNSVGTSTNPAGWAGTVALVGSGENINTYIFQEATMKFGGDASGSVTVAQEAHTWDTDADNNKTNFTVKPYLMDEGTEVRSAVTVLANSTGAIDGGYFQQTTKVMLGDVKTADGSASITQLTTGSVTANATLLAGLLTPVVADANVKGCVKIMTLTNGNSANIGRALGHYNAAGGDITGYPVDQIRAHKTENVDVFLGFLTTFEAGTATNYDVTNHQTLTFANDGTNNVTDANGGADLVAGDVITQTVGGSVVSGTVTERTNHVVKVELGTVPFVLGTAVVHVVDGGGADFSLTLTAVGDLVNIRATKAITIGSGDTDEVAYTLTLKPATGSDVPTTYTSPDEATTAADIAAGLKTVLEANTNLTGYGFAVSGATLTVTGLISGVQFGLKGNTALATIAGNTLTETNVNTTNGERDFLSCGGAAASTLMTGVKISPSINCAADTTLLATNNTISRIWTKGPLSGTNYGPIINVETNGIVPVDGSVLAYHGIAVKTSAATSSNDNTPNQIAVTAQPTLNNPHGFLNATHENAVTVTVEVGARFKLRDGLEFIQRELAAQTVSVRLAVNSSLVERQPDIQVLGSKQTNGGKGSADTFLDLLDDLTFSNAANVAIDTSSSNTPTVPVTGGATESTGQLVPLLHARGGVAAVANGLRRGVGLLHQITINAATDVINADNTITVSANAYEALRDNDKVLYNHGSEAIITGLAQNTTYFVKKVATATKIQLSATSGGTAIGLTASSGNHTLSVDREHTMLSALSQISSTDTHLLNLSVAGTYKDDTIGKFAKTVALVSTRNSKVTITLDANLSDAGTYVVVAAADTTTRGKFQSSSLNGIYTLDADDGKDLDRRMGNNPDSTTWDWSGGHFTDTQANVSVTVYGPIKVDSGAPHWGTIDTTVQMTDTIDAIANMTTIIGLDASTGQTGSNGTVAITCTASAADETNNLTINGITCVGGVSTLTAAANATALEAAIDGKIDTGELDSTQFSVSRNGAVLTITRLNDNFTYAADEGLAGNSNLTADTTYTTSNGSAGQDYALILDVYDCPVLAFCTKLTDLNSVYHLSGDAINSHYVARHSSSNHHANEDVYHTTLDKLTGANAVKAETLAGSGFTGIKNNIIAVGTYADVNNCAVVPTSMYRTVTTVAKS